MKITPELTSLQSDYMQAKSEKNTTEMNRLKAKAMDLMKNEKTKKVEKPTEKNEKNSIVLNNKDGDSIQISTEGKLKIQNGDNAGISS